MGRRLAAGDVPGDHHRCGRLAEIAVDALGNRAHQAAAGAFVVQDALVFRIGDEAHLQQDGRNVWRQQDGQTRVAVAAPQQRMAVAFQMGQQHPRELGRTILGGALGHVQQDAIDRGVTPRQTQFALPVVAARELAHRAARTLLTEIEGANHPLLRRSHRDAGLAVLLAPDVPAVLLEMGYITNPEDERLLTDVRARRRLMRAVASGIDAYFAAPTGALQVASTSEAGRP